MSGLAERYKQVLDRIHSAQKPAIQDVQLIAVSKFQSVESIRALYDLGQRDFGENYVQELVKKAQTFSEQGISDIRWHFVGNLQTNKVKTLLPYVSSIQSVDSLKLAKRAGPPFGHASRQLSIFLHVNIDLEETKSGIAPLDTLPLAKAISELAHLRLEGLMCIPNPKIVASSGPKNAFARLRELELQCRPYTGGKLSMGMSDDFELAIREGATHIRLGTSLFGPRSP